MKHETLFTASKWSILTALRGGGKSPMQLAEALDTSVANVSQQLRLLEMAGLVTSRRVANTEKGKPRVLYSLNGDQSYIITAAEDFVDKQFHDLSERNKAMLRIWFADVDDQYILEKAFWNIEEYLPDDCALLADTRVPEFLVIGDDVEVPDTVEVTGENGETTNVPVQITHSEDTDQERFTTLYDPNGVTGCAASS